MASPTMKDDPIGAASPSPSFCPSQPPRTAQSSSSSSSSSSSNNSNESNAPKHILKARRRLLDPSAQSFLDHLGLPLVHPLCPEKEEYGDYGDYGAYYGTYATTKDARISEIREMHEELSQVGKGVFEIPAASSFERNTSVSSLGDASQLLKFPHSPDFSSEELVPPPIVGPMSLLDRHDGSFYELFLTAATMGTPTFAMAELWVRLFAFFLSPLCLAWMIQREIRSLSVGGKDEKVSTKKKKKMSKVGTVEANIINSTHSGINDKEENRTIAISLLGLASSAVLFTDSLYVYEYGRSFGSSLFVFSSILTLRFGSSMGNSVGNKRKRASFLCGVVILIMTTIIVFLRSDGGHAMGSILDNFSSLLSPNASSDSHQSIGISLVSNGRQKNQLTSVPDPGIDLPTIEPGLYFSSSNPLLSSVASHWPESSRTYTTQTGATPYLVNGDQRTGIPFLINKVEGQEYVRAWVKNPFDGEMLALDIAFPFSNWNEGSGNVVGDEEALAFVHDLNKPVYLVLHGLNGGSHEEYVKDFVRRRRSEGSTVAVLIARGMMDTLISSGWNVFHGARTGDVDIAARALKRGLDSLAKSHVNSESDDRNDIQRPMNRQILAGVGYSMGAIILSNYVARSGSHCALDGAMAISGGLDLRQQLNFKRSMRLWQPMLTFGLREDILLGKYARHYKHRLTQEQFTNMLRVTSISDLDVEAIVNYNLFDDLVHYYSEMSAMGDREPEFDLFGSSSPRSKTSWGRIENVSIPFAVLHALDDPLVTWRTIGTERPQELVDSGSGNVMLLLTKAGGHVGWPLGNNPKKHGWKWMNDAARDFVLAVDKAKKKMK